MIENLIIHLIEFAPAVAVLLLLQWRHERRLDEFFTKALNHLVADANAQNNKNKGD